jgi:D-aminopeptidase
MLAGDPAVGRDAVVIPMVGECDDSWLSDGRDVQVTADDVRLALEAARGAEEGPLEEGAVGAGTGMIAFGLKGGIGTASRVVDGYVVAALVLANFGDLERLTVDGVPVGRQLVTDGLQAADDAPAGSCIAVLATDAPLNPAQLSGPARSRITAAARSLPRSRLRREAPPHPFIRTRGSTVCSPAQSRPPKRRSSAVCSRRRP